MQQAFNAQASATYRDTELKAVRKMLLALLRDPTGFLEHTRLYVWAPTFPPIHSLDCFLSQHVGEDDHGGHVRARSTRSRRQAPEDLRGRNSSRESDLGPWDLSG